MPGDTLWGVCFGAGMLCAGRVTDRVLCFSRRMVPSYLIMPSHTILVSYIFSQFQLMNKGILFLAC